MITETSMTSARWEVRRKRTEQFNTFAYAFVFASILSCASTVVAQRDLRNIPQADPTSELAAFKVADGFEVNLWAADPLLAKPTQITFDRQGRLWASSSETYPQLNVNQAPTDRIVILEDTDRDGVADKSSVFSDKLLIPGGVLPDEEGGAYVAHAEQLLYLKDTDGDGIADDRQVVLSGFGSEDTHHTLHRLSWGPDGLLYMLQGYYIGTHVETIYGPRRLNGGGLWAYDTKTRRLEIYSRGLTNPWGVRFDRWGQTFQTDGAGGDGINYSFPESVFLSSPHENRFLRGLNPKRPKLCGIEIISGKHFPEAWQGAVVAADFRANNIDRYNLEERDGGYVSTLGSDIIQSKHISFRPIDMVMGPDGALYVADWYSPIIQHGEVDFRDERRDHIHGRIWRITAKNRPLAPIVDYKNASIEELFDLLKSDEEWIRLNAKQALKHRDELEVVAKLESWLNQLNTNDPQYEHHRLEALWTYQTVSSERSSKLARELMKSPDHRVRAAAVRVLYHWPTSTNALDTLKIAVHDEHPRVRREAVTALSRVASPEAANAALQALNHPMDQYLDFALWRTCRILEPSWFPAFQQQEMDFDGDATRMAFALKAIEKQEALAPLVDLLKRNSDDADPAVVRLIGKIGSAQDLEPVVAIASSKAHPAAKDAANALLEAATDRAVLPGNEKLRSLVCQTLLESSDEQVINATCRLIGVWGPDSKRAVFEDKLAAFLSSESQQRRKAAAWGLAGLGSRSRLIAATREADSNARVPATAALVSLNPKIGVASAMDLLSTELNEVEVEELMEAILTQANASQIFANDLQDANLNQQSATYASRLVETSGVSNRADLISLLQNAGGLQATSTLDANSRSTLISRIADHGDPKRGAVIFADKKLTCVKCHAIKGTGGNIGPDLSSIGAAAPVDYLIESLLNPSKKIKEGYRMTVIGTDDGHVYSGMVVREDTNVVIVRNAAGQEMRVAKSGIESRETSPVSMMPSGLTDLLTQNQLADLVAYLATLGKQ